MKKTLRILLVEDSLGDAELLLLHLRRGGYQPESRRVQTRAEMKTALESESWDVVVSDFSMPSFSGLGALELMKEGGYDLPFIIVSGAIGEETAVRAMRGGANDYIMKDNLARLAPAIEREMREFRGREERRRVEAEIRKLSLAVRQSPVSVVMTDLDGKIEYVNPKFTELTGYSYMEAIGENPRILNAGTMAPEHYKELWATVTAGKVWHGEFHNKKKNGVLYWEDATISPIVDDSGETRGYLAVKEDITARKESEDELKSKTKELDNLNHDLHELTLEITKVEENARKRFAGLLHDDIGQNLVAVNMALSSYVSATASSDADCAALVTLGEAGDLLQETIDSIRNMCKDLYPVSPYGERVMGSKGLVGALMWYAGNVLSPTGIEVDVDACDIVEELSDEYKQHIYKILQECLQNIAKHSSATSVKITCSLSTDVFRISVEDDGVGLQDRDCVVDEGGTAKGASIGIRLMRERIKAMDGTLSITSKIGIGTCVIAEFPMP
ncbi:diguanylate cyclase/phosphodiesterase (GGDEF & EAL domains) with PAS/PAC sensor(s) [hydrothermal vent metagenome]|uniref:Diguanylate cyclase/phosphodiesterase (GGDEF & EAL domains) with PAS/PAC sensor(S) n=1 Tax=hydrothermal vent metagenome TaxID=652676 RepID=A0A3B0QU86_9ZZZZ